MQESTLAPSCIPPPIRSMKNSEDILVSTLSEFLAAEVKGVDLSAPISGLLASKIYESLVKHSVLVFRNQCLEAEHVRAFSMLFGKLVPHVVRSFGLKTNEDVIVLSNMEDDRGEKVGADRSGMDWHSDGSYRENPAKFSVLYGVKCPPLGANTEFCSTQAAYGELDTATQVHLSSLEGIHDYWWYWDTFQSARKPLTAAQKREAPPVVHPAVITHPDTGLHATYLSESVTSGIKCMDATEGRDLVLKISAFASQPKFQYVHEWREGDLVIWDNRTTMHRATEFDNKYDRYMLKTAIKGDPPQYAAR